MSLTKARELAVLSVLIAHPAHGYQIAAAFEEGPLQLLGLKRAAVYAILARFAERGWIIEREEDGGRYPDRTVSFVTDAGREAANDLIAQAGGLSQSPLMALLLLHDSGVDVRAALAHNLDLRRALVARWDRPDPDHRESASRRMAVAGLVAEIAMLEDLLEA